MQWHRFEQTKTPASLESSLLLTRIQRQLASAANLLCLFISTRGPASCFAQPTKSRGQLRYYCSPLRRGAAKEEGGSSISVFQTAFAPLFFLAQPLHKPARIEVIRDSRRPLLRSDKITGTSESVWPSGQQDPCLGYPAPEVRGMGCSLLQDPAWLEVWIFPSFHSLILSFFLDFYIHLLFLRVLQIFARRGPLFSSPFLYSSFLRPRPWCGIPFILPFSPPIHCQVFIFIFIVL